MLQEGVLPPEASPSPKGTAAPPLPPPLGTSGLGASGTSSCRGVFPPRLWCGRAVLYISTARATACVASSKVCSSEKIYHEFLRVLFILSARALCSGSTVWVMLMWQSCARSKSVYRAEAYCTPRSLWWIMLWVSMLCCLKKSNAWLSARTQPSTSKVGCRQWSTRHRLKASVSSDK